MLPCNLVNKYFQSTVMLYIQQEQTQLKATLKASLCSLISNTSKRRSLCYLGKKTHDHGNFRATHRTSPFHNRHTHSTCFTETRMSARHQCETTTWRHKTNFTKVVVRCSLGRRCRIGRRTVVEVVATGTGSCWSSDGFTFLLSQVFRHVNWRFCDLYSAVIIR